MALEANLSTGSRFRLIAIVAAVFVIGIIVGISVHPLTNNPSNLPTTTSISSSVLQVQSVTSQTVASNSTYSVEILSVAFDQVDAPTGYSDYLLTVNASYIGGESWQLDTSNFHLTTNELSVYNSSTVSGEKNPLTNIMLMSGQHATGQITFAVLNGQKPTRLQYYTDPSVVVVETDYIPETSSWVSLVPAAIVNYDNPTTSNLTVMASILNSTQYFYSTEVIIVKMSISYQQLNNGPSSVLVKSITEQDPGFTMLSTNPPVPIAILGNNQQVTITLTILPPHSSYSGGIHIEVGITN
ncbi:MAG TPA: hypothetical protein VE862_06160 [Candidatus Acidoferrum sp.]|nr:hypothetical protein [Candidatus Acidoferrum sp.]